MDTWTTENSLLLFNKSPFNDIVYYEDCIEGMKKLPSASVDVIVADPPFGISFSGKERIYNRNPDFVVKDYNEPHVGYDIFSNSWIKQITRLMKDTSTAWIFSGWTHLDDVLNAGKSNGLNLVNHLIWKYQFGVYTKRKFVTSHYHLLFYSKSKNYYFNKIENYPEDVWVINRKYRKAEMKNGTKLPEELVSRCLRFSTKPGDVVLDPFMGNGTTAVVSKGMYRHYIGFEINNNMKNIIDFNISNTISGQYL